MIKMNPNDIKRLYVLLNTVRDPTAIPEYCYVAAAHYADEFNLELLIDPNMEPLDLVYQADNTQIMTALDVLRRVSEGLFYRHHGGFWYSSGHVLPEVHTGTIDVIGFDE